MTTLQSLFKHLVVNRPHAIRSWAEDYKMFTGEISKIQTELKKNLHLNDPAVYVGTRFEHEPQPEKAFARTLIFQKYNYISSRGQSTLSLPNFEDFVKDVAFMRTLEGLIRDPNSDTFKNFRDQWTRMGKGNRPLLVNRTLAACTLDVTTTADESKFQKVFQWLINEDHIATIPNDSDWYTKNLHVVKELRKNLPHEELREAQDLHLINIFVWELFVYISNPFLKKQAVLYGPPGTGKTHTALEQARLFVSVGNAGNTSEDTLNPDDYIVRVQFHPSFSYEDFMDGLRPELVNGESRLVLRNGIFKELCRKAAVWELDVFKLDAEISEKWETLRVQDLKQYREKLEGKHWEPIFNHPDDTILTDVVPRFFLVIDEMNRAELSRVLGELMFSLEYRGIRGAIQTQYARLNDKDTKMLQIKDEFRFFVPHNVYIIGTMNTIDRSIESFDFALRRRFHWEKVMPDYNLLRHHLQENFKQWEELGENLEKLNRAIKDEPILGEDYQIGHTYLMNLKYPPGLSAAQVRKGLWQNFIAPLIEEYLRGTGKGDELMDGFKEAFGVR
jgi:5-methylcytosine-specific restriction enzyme B